MLSSDPKKGVEFQKVIRITALYSYKFLFVLKLLVSKRTCLYKIKKYNSKSIPISHFPNNFGCV